MSSDELVTVYLVKRPGLAEIIRLALQSEGIDCFVEGEGQAFSGIVDVELQVKAQDADRARQFIQDRMDSIEHQEDPVDDDEDDDAGESEEEEDQFE